MTKYLKLYISYNWLSIKDFQLLLSLIEQLYISCYRWVFKEEHVEEKFQLKLRRLSGEDMIIYEFFGNHNCWELMFDLVNQFMENKLSSGETGGLRMSDILKKDKKIIKTVENSEQSVDKMSEIGIEEIYNLLYKLNSLYRIVRKKEEFDIFIMEYEDKMVAVKGERTDFYRKLHSMLQKVKSPDGIEDLKSALKDSDLETRRNAIEALGKTKNQEVIKDLRDGLRDRDNIVRRKTAEALGKIGTSDAMAGLKVALQDQDKFVRREAVEALGKIGNTETISILSDILKKDNDYVIRRKVVDVLRQIGGNNISPVLIASLNDENWYVRCGIVEALGYMADPEVAEILKQISEHDPDKQVRKRAQIALKQKELL
ncbi:MAG: HEAT repeat domain-containing protein [Candidatus Eremiobacterota bacterium]